MQGLTARISKRFVVYVVVVLLVLVFGFCALVFKTPQTTLAHSLVLAGNSFFGGFMPHSLSVADKAYAAALILDPNVADAWHQRARIAFLKGDFADAREKINRQIEIHGDSFMAAYYIRGLIDGYDKRYASAEKDFEHFLTWDPKNWAANNDLAWLYFSQGRFDKVIRQTEQALGSNPENPWLLMMRGMAYYNVGRMSEARLDLLVAQKGIERLDENDWRKAYPGNDPRAAAQGLLEMRQTVSNNLELVHNQEAH